MNSVVNYLEEKVSNVDNISEFYTDLIEKTAEFFNAKYGLLVQINYEDSAFKSQFVVATTQNIKDRINSTIDQLDFKFSKEFKYMESIERSLLKEEYQEIKGFINIPIIYDDQLRYVIFLMNCDRIEVEDSEKTFVSCIRMLLKVADGKYYKNKHVENELHEKYKFLTNMSHKIITPLNSISSVLRLLDNNNLDETQKKYINIAYESSKSLISLFNDILLLAKNDNRKVELYDHHFNLNTLIEDVLSITNVFKEKKLDVDLVYNVEENVPINLIGDVDRLRQILYNLIGNAIRFTENGYVKTLVKFLEKQDNQIILRFIVEDTGSGIDKSKITRLFRPFIGIGDNILKKGGRLRLGLSICKFLVNLFGGDINVESEVGKGTIFTFDIPLKEDETVVHITNVEIKLITLIGDLQIGIYDKHQTNCLFLKNSLSKYCNNVYSSNDPEEFEKLMNTYDLDLIIIGSDLKNKVCLELLKKIRKERKIKTINLCLDTTKFKKNQKMFNKVIIKPVRQHTLYKVVYDLFCEELTDDDEESSGYELETSDEEDYLESIDENLKILIVEDDPINRTIFKKLLINEGFNNISEAYNGANALQVLGDCLKYDIVFMDIDMPIMNGLEATKRIKKINRNLPVIALTAFISPDVRDKCEEIGFTDYLIKPYDLKKIIKVISNIDFTFGKNINIFVVENDDNVRKNFVNMLKSNGYNNIHCAINGKDALAKINPKFEIIFIDIFMPEMDGIELIKEIRKIDNETPIIAISIDSSEDMKNKCIQSGFTKYIPKPFMANDIIKIIDEFKDIYLDHNQESSSGSEVITDVSINDLIDTDDERSYLNDPIINDLQKINSDKEYFKKIFGVTLQKYFKTFIKKFRDKNTPENELLSYIHNFKGMLHQIGLKKLGNEISNIEEYIKKGDGLYYNQIEYYIDMLKIILQKSLEELSDKLKINFCD